MRIWWAPPCQGPWARMSLYGYGAVSVRPAIVEAVKALNNCLIAHRYPSDKEDTGAYNCRRITGGTGYSPHAYGIAIDLNWQENPYGRRLVTDMPVGMRTAIKAIRTNNGKQVWRWGGDYINNKDAMHWEIICSPSDLKTGINWKTVPGKSAAPAPTKPVLRPGDKGEAVKFLQGMLNILKAQRINSKGKPANTTIKVDGVYSGQTTEAVRELERFANVMLKIAKKPTIPVDGIADEAVLNTIALWVPIVLKKK